MCLFEQVTHTPPDYRRAAAAPAMTGSFSFMLSAAAVSGVSPAWLLLLALLCITALDACAPCALRAMSVSGTLLPVAGNVPNSLSTAGALKLSQ